MNQAVQTISTLKQNIQRVIRGKEAQIDIVLTALFAGGHILLEDNPGTGKTVLAKTLANSIGSGTSTSAFKRVQFTPDLLPMDLLGSHIYDDNKKDFVFKKGPLFCNILLADEINRASPKVQSALLECMAEQQITAGDISYQLEKLFFTVATQNPIESEGTYPLPAAQLDRFFIKTNLGYADTATEEDILSNYNSIKQSSNNTTPVVSIDDVMHVQSTVQEVFVHPQMIKAVVQLLEATRNNAGISLGASTRAGIALLQCLRSYALIKGRNYVTEDDLAALYHPVLHHRLEFRNSEAQQLVLANIATPIISKLSNMRPQ
ncbi:MAG: hypothetical protein RL660_3028 [Bacteroidota bacterium]|jgi:MoxR-like ATPase